MGLAPSPARQGGLQDGTGHLTTNGVRAQIFADYATFLFRSAAQASLEEIAPAARHKLPDLRQTQGGSVEHGAIGLWPAGRARRRHQCWPRQPEHNLGAG